MHNPVDINQLKEHEAQLAKLKHLMFYSLEKKQKNEKN